MVEYNDIVSVFSEQTPMCYSSYGTVCGVDKVKRRLKVTLEPYGIETGWCSVLKGAFTEKLDTEVIVLAVGKTCELYVVCGIIDKPEE